MSSNFVFQIFTPQRSGTLQEQLLDIEMQYFIWLEHFSYSSYGLLQTRIYLSDAANQWAVIKESPLYVESLSKGAVSYIEQPLLQGCKVAIQICLSTSLDIQKKGCPEQMEIIVDGVRFLFHSVRFTSVEAKGLDAEAQTMLAFERHEQLLRNYAMTLERNCHRTWLYVRDIDRHYAGVVAGRNRVFSRCGLTADNHYIASTGIGGYTDNREAVVAVDFLSVEGPEDLQVKYLSALEYLNPTHEYGVAFERGTRLTLPQGNVYFISGTASIDKHGECVHRGEVLTQAGRLFLNIEKLLNDGAASLKDVQYMIVYLRDIADYEAVASYMALRFPQIPKLITEARVCRPEWLMEVECVAMTAL